MNCIQTPSASLRPSPFGTQKLFDNIFAPEKIAKITRSDTSLYNQAKIHKRFSYPIAP